MVTILAKNGTDSSGVTASCQTVKLSHKPALR